VVIATGASNRISHENARRLDRSRPPGAEKIRACSNLEHAEHDGADKGEGQIRGDNAQSAGESHGNASCFTSLPALTRILADRSVRKKSALLPLRLDATRARSADNVVKES
jgi:hypothetical protein